MGLFDNLDPVAGTDVGDGLFSDIQRPSEVVRRAKRGALGFGADVSRFAEGVAGKFNAPGLKQTFAGMADTARAAQEEIVPEFESWKEDVHGVGDALQYAKGVIAEQAIQVPIVAASALFGRGFGATFKPAHRLLATMAGGAGAAAVPSFAQNVGNVYEELKEAGHDDFNTALKYGIPITAADVVGPSMIAGLFKKGAAPIVKKTVQEYLKRLLAGSAIGLSEEALTEGGQERLQVQAHADVDPTFDPNSPENKQRVLEAAIAGGVVGGFAGGVGGGVHTALSPTGPEPSVGAGAPVTAPVSPTTLGDSPAPTAPIQVAPVSPDAETGAFPELNTAFPLVDPSLGAPQVDPLAEREFTARLAQADEEFAASPERLTSEVLKSRIPQLEAEIVALDTESKSKSKKRRPAAEIAADRVALTSQIAAINTRTEALDKVSETPTYQPKSPLVQGTLLSVHQPEVPNVRSQGAIEVFERIPTETTPAKTGTKVAQTSGSRPEEAFNEAIGRIKKDRGMIMSAAEVKAVGAVDKATAAGRQPIAVERVMRTRERAPAPDTQPEALRANRIEAVKGSVQDWVKNNLIRPEVATSVGSTINKAVEAAQSTVDPEAREAIIVAGVKKALRGKNIVRADVESITDGMVAVLNDLGSPITDISVTDIAQRSTVSIPGLSPFEISVNEELGLTQAAMTIDRDNKAAAGSLTPYQDKAIAARIADIQAGLAPQVFDKVPQPFKLSVAKTVAAKAVKSTIVNGGFSYNLVMDQDMYGTNNYAVSPFKSREVAIPNTVTESQVKEYIEANEDLLRDPTNMLGTWLRTRDGHTVLDVVKITPSLAKAQIIARRAGQEFIFNLRTGEEIRSDSAAPAQTELFRNADQFLHLDRVYQGKAGEALEYLEKIIGTPEQLEVQLFTAQAGGPSGSYRVSELMDVISLAKNAGNIKSTAAHEGFHFLEQRVMSQAHKAALRVALRPGSAMFKRLETVVREYDKVNGTTIFEEIHAIPAEARAYAYDFWEQGKMEVQGPVQKAFEFIRQILERISNFFDGMGFNSAEDIFQMIDRGMYARREVQALRIEDSDGTSWINDIEPDAIPGLQKAGDKTIKSTASSQAKGRPYWVKSGTDVVKMRKRLKALALEGETARNWHKDSGDEILKLYNGDVKQATILAKLIAIFSARTPVGMDLVFALKAIDQFRRNEPIHSGRYPVKMSENVLNVLTGTEEETIVTGKKRNTFFGNMMLAIDPTNFNIEDMGATIDMWMHHVFGFNHSTSGPVTDAEYNYASAEVGRLARELGWQIEETQAAIWVATKARWNQTRKEMKSWGISKGMYEAARVKEDTGLFEAAPGGKAVVLKKDPATQRAFLENWAARSLAVPLDQRNLDDAHYNYGMAIRELRSTGRVTSHNIAAGDAFLPELGVDLYKNVEQDITTGQNSFMFYSKAALADMITMAKRGEAQPSQMYSVLSGLIDKADIPEATIKATLGNTVKGFTKGGTGSLKTFYDEWISSGMNLARKSTGYKNVFNVLTAYTQRKNRLIANTVDNKLSEWVASDATNDNMTNVSRSLLERTVNAHQLGSPEMGVIMQRMSVKERAMFTQATKMIEDRLLAEFVADQASFGKLLGVDTPAYAQWLANRSTQVEQLIQDGYFPERRYGDHGVHIYMDVDGKRLTLAYELNEFRGQAETRVKDLQDILKDFPELKTEYAFKYKAEFDGSISFQQFLDVARRQGVDLTQAEKERLAKAMVASDSVRRNRIFRRKNVPGYSEDGRRILTEFAVTMANKIAYSEFGSSIQDTLKGTVVDSKFDAEGNPIINSYENTNAWAQDGELSGFYRNLADKTTDFVMSPNPGNKASTFLRGAATVNFLGGTLAVGMVQLSSLGMNTTPYLSQHTSYTDALGKTLSGLKIAIANPKLTDIAALQNTTLAIPDVDSVAGLRHNLTVAAQDGTTLDTEIYQIMGLTRGKLLSQSRGVQKALKLWMTPFRKTEQWNRIATFIAAHKIGLQNNIGGDALYKFAQDAVYNTQFRYDEANRPGIARGPVGAMLFTFKTYPIFMMETMYALSKENPKAAVIMLLSLTAMAGIEGIPFVEDIEDVIDTIAQRAFGSTFNSKRALRNIFKDMSEMMVGVDLSGWAMHGIANQMTGLNFANRVGLGNLIPGSRMGAADADYKKVMTEILGPTGSVAQGWISGADALTRGEFHEAAKVALPLAAQNLIKGVEQFSSGFAQDVGGRNLVQANGFEAFAQSLGFSSSALSSAYETDRIDRASLAFYTQAKQQITSDIIKAVKRGDSSAIQEAVDAIGAWSRVHPDMPMIVNGPSVRRSLALAGMSLNERTLRLLPKALRGSSQSMDELYGDNR